MADFASLRVGTGVVNGIWKLIFDFLGCLSLNRLGDGRVAGVGHALTGLILAGHFDRGGGKESGCVAG